jgi:hypothetical protein
MTNFSVQRAQEVEAACWSPRLKITDANFQNLALTKARECSSALCRQFGLRDVPHAPSVNFYPPPVFPIQMVVAPAPERVFIAVHPPRTPTPVEGLCGADQGNAEEEYQIDWNPPMRDFDAMIPY